MLSKINDWLCWQLLPCCPGSATPLTLMILTSLTSLLFSDRLTEALESYTLAIGTYILFSLFVFATIEILTSFVVIGADPSYAKAFNNRGVVHRKLQQYPEAIQVSAHWLYFCGLIRHSFTFLFRLFILCLLFSFGLFSLVFFCFLNFLSSLVLLIACLHPRAPLSSGEDYNDNKDNLFSSYNDLTLKATCITTYIEALQHSHRITAVRYHWSLQPYATTTALGTTKPHCCFTLVALLLHAHLQQ